MVVSPDTTSPEPGEEESFNHTGLISSTPLKSSRIRRDLARPSLLPLIEDQFDESDISIGNKSTATPRRLSPAPSQILPPPTETSSPLKRLRSPSRSNSPLVPMPKPRLVISKLVLINFKSYAGRQEIGPFNSVSLFVFVISIYHHTNQSFSAIVGPNGSGKSNVIDSLLFVFGFRASKMRHSKISALIHNSNNAMKANSCTVEVHFRDVIDTADGESEPVPGSELVIARTCTASNNSKYTINGQLSSHTEVTQLLRLRGIDIDHKRFLILQGEIESIAQMKAKADKDNDDGLLEYLEDIIGTAKYKQALEDTQKEIETLNEDCAEKNNRLTLVQKELDGLVDQKNEVLKMLKIENSMTRKQSALYQLISHEASAHIAKSTHAVQQKQLELDEEAKKTGDNQDEIQELTKRHDQILSDIRDKKARADQLSKSLSKKELEKVRIEEKIKHLDTKAKKITKSLEASNKTKGQIETWIDTHTRDSTELEENQVELEAELESELKEMEVIQESLKSKTQQYTDEIEELQRELSPWKDKLAAKDSEISVAKSELELLKEQESAAERAVKEAQKYGQDVMEQGQQKEQELATVQAELENIVGQIERGTAKCQKSETEVNDLKAELNEVREKVDAVKDRLMQTKSQNRVLAGLSRLSKSGRLKGFRGRLGDLGYIDPKYDVAVSTACAALDNMVVDTVESGQECIEYLRKNNLGRARFILLNQQSQRDFSPIQTPENVPRLFDLINPIDERYRQAFYNVVNDTLVARDIDHARKIAYGGRRRWRVVTLDGALVESSGAMSGGGQVFRGKMCLGKDMMAAANDETSDADLDQMNRELATVEEKYNEAQKLHDHMVDALNSLKEKKPHLESRIPRLELEISTLEKTMKEARRRFKETQQEAKLKKPDTKTIDSKESMLVKLQTERDKLETEVKKLSSKIDELQEQIIQVGGLQLRMQKSKVDGLKDRIANISDRLVRGISEKAKQENLLKRETKNVENYGKELEQIKEQNDQLEEELSSMKGGFSELETQVTTINNELEDEQEVLESLKTSLAEKQEEVDSMRSREIELKNSIEELNKAIAEQERRQTKYRELLDDLKLHDLSEFESIDSEIVSQNRPENNDNGPEEDTSDREMSMEVDEEDSQLADKENDGQQATSSMKKAAASTGEGASQAVAATTYELHQFSDSELQSLNAAELKQQISQLEEQTKDARIDMSILRDYKRRMEEFNARKSVVSDAVNARDRVKQTYNDLASQRLSEFMTGFNTISAKLKEMYQMITMGGNAELELVDTLDPFSEGILFSVMPPKKSWRNISNLSGGEKTLSSLALVFALHTYKPTPLYVMDEIDAALDFRNVSIVASYIKDRTKNGQFIVISLRNNMFELARQLVGIYKVNNMTRSIPLINDDIVHEKPQHI